MPILKSNAVGQFQGLLTTTSYFPFWKNIASTSMNVIDPANHEKPSIKIGSRQDWLFLIPVVGSLMVGAMTIPHFTIGMRFGLMKWGINTLMAVTLVLGRQETPMTKDDEYTEFLQSSMLYCALWAPIKEELIFRGAIQKISAAAIALAIPNLADEQFYWGNFPIATAISIFTTSLIFGALHVRNEHSLSYFQGISSFMSSMISGYAAAQYGFGAAVAQHITNNLISTMILNLATINKRENEQTSQNLTPALA
jgi:membrane protease YdiL (CAAX protease family)